MPFTQLTPEDMETMSRDELIDKITELQDLLAEAKENTRDTGKRIPTERRKTRSVRVVGGRLVMGYVLGKGFENSNRIQREVKELLENEEERTDGLCITVNNRELTLTLWSHSEIGLDMMEERIKELVQEATDKVESGELRPRPRTDRRHRSHRYHDDRREHRHRSHRRRDPHDSSHLYRGIH